ncbi:MAG: methyltransferase type 12 [Pseudonocardiales bacterium]|nr:MAG: methyltransferase type 12 [Pseudonocardiales bacterium]
MTADPLTPAPDDKDWTWVLQEPCSECGFDARVMSPPDDLPVYIRAVVSAFASALGRPDAAERPAPEVWSPLEYGCHVRDVCLLYDERLQLMLAQDDPLWANWDQDATAIESRYWSQDPAEVAKELALAGVDIAASFAEVRDDQWQRPGRRSGGSVFTIDTLARYFAHDLVHHVHDIGG